MYKIAFPDAPEWVQSVKLDGSTYKLRARWNTFSEAWSLDVLTKSGTLIVGGLRLVRGQALLIQFNDDDLPPGDFFVYDVSSTGDDYADFIAGRAVLAYVTEDEVSELSSDD